MFYHFFWKIAYHVPVFVSSTVIILVSIVVIAYPDFGFIGNGLGGTEGLWDCECFGFIWVEAVFGAEEWDTW
jgi:hypothetical protein